MPELVAVSADVVFFGVLPFRTSLHQEESSPHEAGIGLEVERHALCGPEGVSEVVEQQLVDRDVGERHHRTHPTGHEDYGPADEVLRPMEPVSEAEHKAAH